MMKMWILSLVISLIPIFGVAIYFYKAIEKAACLSSGGVWSGLFRGCDMAIEEGYYSLTISPISTLMALTVWLLFFFLISFILKKFQFFK